MFSYCATLNDALTLDTDETPDFATPTAEPSDTATSTAKQKHARNYPKYLELDSSETQARMSALPKYLRNAVLNNGIEMRSFNWRSSLDSLSSSSEKVKAATSLMWFIRKRTANRMRKPVEPGLPNRTCMPMKRLNILLNTEKDIGAYIERHTVGRKSAKQMAKTRTVIQLPETVEHGLVSEEFLEAGWLERTVKDLEPGQQREVIKSTINILTDGVRSSIETVGLNAQRQRFLAIIAEAKSLYKELNPDAAELTTEFDITRRRSRNPFTWKLHGSLEGERQATLKWQYAEQARLNRLSKKLDSTTDLAPELIRSLQEMYNTTGMKLRAVKIYLEKLELENAPVESESLKLATKHLTIPYRAQHHMLKDVLSRFKVGLFEFGQRFFPKIMQREGWYEPEGLSITEFGDILDQHRNMHDFYKICSKQWDSLRRIRNSSVHDIPQMSVARLEELLDDCKDLAYFMECPGIDVLVDRYNLLLNNYKDDYMGFLTSHEQKLRDQLEKIDEERDAALSDLDTLGCKDFEEINEKLREDFHEKRHILMLKFQRTDRDRKPLFTRDLVRYSVLSHIRHCLDSEDSAWAAEATGALAKEYAGRGYLSQKPLEREAETDSQDG
ncbi:hypothetical protein PtrV1_10285 [Pyrenophora tritici-repentis]|nr:hypothetical protein PtrV1_10285 [Pyrenophora tritici-repentis]PZD28386.1 hypothetical protein A1F96_05928 [Pyrenophora tritici-repentis]